MIKELIYRATGMGTSTSVDRQQISDANIAYKVRHGTDPDNPILLDELLRLPPIFDQLDLEVKRSYLVTQFNLLLDTFADDFLPSHWRRHCLDQIYLPMQRLEQLANCKKSRAQLLSLGYELRVTTNYYHASL